MRFTGERYIPNDPECGEIKYEHESRYIFASRFVDSKLVADIGCGVGYGSKILAQQNPISIVGLDLSLEAVRYANSNYKHEKIKYLNSHSETLPLFDNQFHIVIAFEIIEHLENFRGLLKEIKRIMKDDGKLIISTPNVVKHHSHKKSRVRDFHVYEFCYHDFKKLLSEYFDSLTFFNQKYNQSILFELHNQNFNKSGDEKEFCLEFDNSFVAESSAEFDGDYIIAICGKKTDPEIASIDKTKIFNISQTSRIHEMRRHLKTLDEEIEVLKKLADERGLWAKKQNEELKDKGKTIQNLRDELETSNAWAIRISDELKDLREKQHQVGILRKILKKFF